MYQLYIYIKETQIVFHMPAYFLHLHSVLFYRYKKEWQHFATRSNGTTSITICKFNSLFHIVPAIALQKFNFQILHIV